MAASGAHGSQAPSRDRRTLRPRGPSHVRRALVPTLTMLGLLAIWQAVVDFGVIQRFLLPSPTDVLSALVGDWALIWEHAQTTLVESIAGLLIGVAIGFVLAVLMDRFEGFYLAMQPLITLSQTVPTVAIAPLLLIWFGYGLAPKIILIVVTTFFPVSVSLVAGFRSTDPDVIDLLRTMHATDLQIFWYAKLPAAADQFFSGLKISATYAIVGAVISEWLGGQSGLGVYMTRVRKSFAYDKMFASIVVVSALSMVLMGLVEVLERVCMPWKRAERKHQ